MDRSLAEQQTEPIRKVPLIIVLLSGAFLAILNQTLLATALPVIKDDLQINDNTVQWLQSIFMLVNGIMIPITAFLIERFTTRGLFMTAMGSFALGTIVCAIAPEFYTLLLGRVLQAAGAGIMMPLMQTIMFLIFPKEKRGTAMGLFGLIISFAPAIGPTLSGYLLEHYPWRSLFYVVSPIAIIDVIVAYFILKNVTKQTFPKVDILSIVLSSLGFGGLLYAFSTAGNAGWTSWQVILTMLLGAVTLLWFILRQLKLEKPILEFRIFKNPVFTMTTVLGMVVFLAMIGGAVILPLLMQDMLGFSPFESGLALLPGAIVMGIMNPITGRLFDKYGAKWLSIIGLLILTVSTFFLTVLTPETTFTYIATVHTFRMLGIAMVMMPVTTAGLNQLSPQLLPHGTAMNNTLRQVAGAIGTAMLVTVMTTTAIPKEGLSGYIHGVDMAFAVAGIIAAVGLVITFFTKYDQTSVAKEN
ncbi:DHA2 family efflux MFS transporter permease subunit [Ornithinibacillus contaminans]|uniref:DHA2 family efflux MFS transporter permease subunit n=1 Tax=Ornithinibacillus contaminans TaxID=694055 RepID=UPI00064DA146|nr:DHA2 family efflux MFS transporter permease subunit [Ornithinibacillus contaminans]